MNEKIVYIIQRYSFALFIVFVWGSCLYLPIPPLVRAFFSLFFIILLPIGIGRIISRGLALLTILLKTDDQIINLIFEWSIGSIFILLYAWLTSLLNRFNLSFMAYSIIIIVILNSITIGKLTPKKSFIPRYKLLSISSNSILKLFLVANAIFVSMTVKAFSPPPLQLMTDGLTETVIFNKIFYNNFFSIYRTTYSSTFFINAKTPFLPLLAAVTSIFTQAQYIFLTWIGTFLMVSLMSIGIYLLAFQLSNEKIVALFASYIGTWIIEFSKPSHVHFLQSSLAAVFLPYFLVVLCRLENQYINGMKKILIIIAISATFLIIHFPLSLFTFISFGFIYIIRVASKRSNYVSLLATIFTFGIVLLICLQKFEYLGTIPLPDFILDQLSTLYGFDTMEYAYHLRSKFNTLDIWYTFPVICLSLLGLVYKALKDLINPIPSINMLSFASWYFIFSLFIFFLPIGKIHRIFPIIHFFIALFAAYLVTRPIKCMKLFINKPIKKSILGILFILIILAPIITYPITSFINTRRFYGNTDGFATTFTSYELSIADQILYDTPVNTLIISEPQTQMFFEAFARIPSLQGLYMNDQSEALVKTAFKVKDDKIIASLLWKAVNETFPMTKYKNLILIVTGRVMRWAESRSRIIYYPFDLNQEDLEYIKNNLINSNYFKLLYSERDLIFVFQVRNPKVLFQNTQSFDFNDPICWNSMSDYSISLEKSDDINATQFLRINGSNLKSGWHPFTLTLPKPVDLETAVGITVKLRINSSYFIGNDRDFSIAIVDEQGKRMWWMSKRSFQIIQGDWQEISLIIWKPDQNEGIDLSKIVQFRFTSRLSNPGYLIVDFSKISTYR